jgi:NitT/TauT family transport system substrate-binding protein
MNWIRRVILSGLLVFMTAPSIAEPVSVRIAKQPGVAYLPLMVMEHEKLLEKHAKALGVDVTTQWLIFTGGSAMNDALLSGRLDIATGGIPPLLTIWAKTRSNYKVKGIASLASEPQFLLTTNPKVKAITDFTAAAKIALPTVKISNQAVMLQMAAIKQLGADKAFEFDPLTVAMGHGDAMAAMLGGSIDAHFGQSPYQELEMKDPRVHSVLNSYDVVGVPYPIAVAYATSRFFDQNPKLLEAFVGALQEAQHRIRTDVDFAAKIWIEMDMKNFSTDEAKAILNNPKLSWNAAPQGTLIFLKHMNKIGLIDADTNDWRDVYFPAVHQMNGS